VKDRTNSERSPLGLTEMLAWVAGLGAIAGLAVEVVRQSSREPASALIGSLIILYLVYVASSVRAFWNIPRIAVPTTLLIGGALWTLALQNIGRSGLVKAVFSAIFIPMAMAYAVRLIGLNRSGSEDLGKNPRRPALVPALLEKGMKLGNRPDRAGKPPDDGDSEIRWVEPLADSLDHC
jgi:hypothetical protein